MNRKTSGHVARAALVGFVFSQATPREAQAYYVGGYLLLTATTTVGLAGTALLVYLTIKIIERPDPEMVETPGATTRHLIDSGLLSNQGDLFMQLQLLEDSPSAYAQLGRELDQGSGPSVDALTQATNLPPDTLQQAWNRAKGDTTLPANPEAARASVHRFLAEIAGDLSIRNDVLSEFAWSLARERSAPDFPANARAHQQLAAWLGLPVEAVLAATATAMDRLEPGPDVELRTRIYASPDAWLDAVAEAIEVEHHDRVVLRLTELATQGREAFRG